MRNTFLLVIFSLLSLRCSTPAPQTDSLSSLGLLIPSTYKIKNVEFIDQGKDFCGPATLAMAMNYFGKSISKHELSKNVYTPGLHGSLPNDILGASRRYGFLALPITRLEDILTEVSNNRPVIVFQNLALSWAPQWHYALVVGYDLPSKTVLLHTGYAAYESVKMKEFENTWRLADFWGVVILPPDQLAFTVGEREHVVAAVALEQNRKFTEAEVSYRKILQRWPDSLVALIGAANFAYQNGKRKEAIVFLKRAIHFHPESVAAKNNLSVAEQK